MQLSILIPVYNVEKYIARCLDAILCQPTDGIEILLGIDGSPDNSGKICEEYAKKYDFIHIFHNKNMGAGAERNFLLDRATGKYVWFVDADDMIAENAIEQIMGHIATHNEIDILSMGFKRFDDKEQYGDLEFGTVAVKEITGKEYLLKESFCGCLWNKVFKRSHLIQHNVRMNDRLVNQEDNLFNLYAIIPCQNILLTNIYGYNYYQSNALSTMRNRSLKSIERNFNDTVLAEKELQHIIKNIEDRDLKQSIEQLLYLNVAGLLYAMYQTKYPANKVKNILSELKDMNLYPAQRSHNRRANLFISLANIERLYILLCRIHS